MPRGGSPRVFGLSSSPPGPFVALVGTKRAALSVARLRNAVGHTFIGLWLPRSGSVRYKLASLVTFGDPDFAVGHAWLGQYCRKPEPSSEQGGCRSCQMEGLLAVSHAF